jgi:hypothetical protein
VLNLATNTSQTIRFDGLQAQPSSTDVDNGNTFSNINVVGTATIANTVTQNLTVSLLELQAAAQLAVITNTGVQPLTEATTPAGVKANSNLGTYGLTRKATADELAAKTGEGYLTPGQIANLPTVAQVAAQILAADEVTVTGNKIKFVNGLTIIFGTYVLDPTWPQAPGHPNSINQFVPFNAAIPGFPGFSATPVVMTRSYHLGGACAAPSTTGFIYSVQDSYTQSSQGGSELMWVAFGY